MKLAEMQALFQAGVTQDVADPRLLAQLAPPPRDSREDGFAVYRDAYGLRHAEFLEHDYPTLKKAMGEDAFIAMAAAYLAAHPSTFRNARWFGAGLPDFLAATDPWRGDAALCGLARLEAALEKAFDAPNGAVVALDRLAGLPPEDWPKLRLDLHPSVILIDLPEASLACYEAAQAEAETLDLAAAAEPIRLLVWREVFDVRYRTLDDMEDLALREAARGASFGDICGLLAFARPGEAEEALTLRAAQWLAQWFANGLVIGVSAQDA